MSHIGIVSLYKKNVINLTLLSSSINSLSTNKLMPLQQLNKSKSVHQQCLPTVFTKSKQKEFCAAAIFTSTYTKTKQRDSMHQQCLHITFTKTKQNVILCTIHSLFIKKLVFLSFSLIYVQNFLVMKLV